jgi:uncharacterized membrane protein YdbT with pleckstrin-like domain
MNDDTAFTTRVSQITNLFFFIVTISVTALFFVFSENIKTGTNDFFISLAELITVPPVNNYMPMCIVLGLFWARLIWNVLKTHSCFYDFEVDRIVMHFGVLNKENDYIEFFRVKDYSIKRSLIARLTGTHSIEIISTDRTHPYLKLSFLTNFSNGESVIRKGIKESTATGRGRELDLV